METINTNDNDIDKTNINKKEVDLFELKVPQTPKIEIKEVHKENELSVIMNDDFSVKQRLYENVLAPQLVENEELKRYHKSFMMERIFSILKFQFIATYVFVIILIFMFILSPFLNLSETIILQTIAFIKFYITSIVVELISILFFIVKNVFDTSISDLFSNFMNNNNEKDS